MIYVNCFLYFVCVWHIIIKKAAVYHMPNGCGEENAVHIKKAIQEKEVLKQIASLLARENLLSNDEMLRFLALLNKEE